MTGSGCPDCAEFQGRTVVNVGRDESWPASFHRLEPVGGPELRRCPGCGALFKWEDEPQMYGSGNNADEVLTRLPRQ
jgi:hypothetical protein